MLCLTLAWLGGVAMHLMEPHLGISAVLWVINPIVVYFGGWMFAVVLWMGLAMLLWATQEGTFGWESIGARTPDLDAD